MGHINTYVYNKLEGIYRPYSVELFKDTLLNFNGQLWTVLW